jgi:hypothetical protein
MSKLRCLQIHSLVPETRILSLEQLDNIFNQSSGDFLRWARREEAGWALEQVRAFVTRSHRLKKRRPQLYEDVGRPTTTVLELHHTNRDVRLRRASQHTRDSSTSSAPPYT